MIAKSCCCSAGLSHVDVGDQTSNVFSLPLLLVCKVESDRVTPGNKWHTALGETFTQGKTPSLCKPIAFRLYLPAGRFRAVSGDLRPHLHHWDPISCDRQRGSCGRRTRGAPPRGDDPDQREVTVRRGALVVPGGGVGQVIVMYT